MIFPSKFEFLIIFGTGFEVFTVVSIHNVVWVRTSYSLVRTWLRILGYECYGGTFWVCLHGSSVDGSSRSRPNRLCWPFRLHSPITENTTISNLNIIHFSCIVSLCHKKLCTNVRQYKSLLIYITLWSEQKCVTENITRNNKLYCLISLCSCFVILLKTYF